MNNQEFIELINHGREERNLEYKGDISWNDEDTRASITKTVLAMSNISDGGIIVIGVHKSGEEYLPNGISDNNYSSFKQDDLSSFINEYADPYVELTLTQIEHNSKKFVIIQIQQFTELPVICKKDGLRNLKRGGIYTRPRRKIESTFIPSQVEMRELIEHAVEIQIIKRMNFFRVAGVDIKETGDDEITKFIDQLKGL